ncbi:MAG: penicillin-binding protein 2 [Pseudomonadota bacterium]
MTLLPHHTLSAETLLFRRRLWLAWGIVLVCFLGLIARFAYIQVYQHAHFQNLAENNRTAILPIPPHRGTIIDRNGVILAHNYPAYVLEVTPSKVNNLQETLKKLGELIEITPKDHRKFKTLMEESKGYEALPLRTRLTPEETARFLVQRFRFPGVEINVRPLRNYPHGEIAAHLMGYIGRINKKDQERIESELSTANYKGTDHIGKIGLEASYESVLHGQSGFEEVEVDASGYIVRSIRRHPPIPGKTLHLTLDFNLQKLAEESFTSQNGALVALDPRNGEILALVSRPSFDPNLFVEGIDPQNWNILNTSEDKPLLNRAIRGAYPPGSTYKPFLALMALETHKRSPYASIADPGYFILPGSKHRFRDDVPGGHGMVDMHRSIVVSCDTYYYRLAADLDIDNVYEFMTQLDFGKKTGIDIPGELDGTLPSRAWKAKRYSKGTELQRRWFLGDNISIGIGQGYNAFTPIQLVHALTILLNNGAVYTPHAVRSIDTLQTGQIDPTPDTPIRRVPFKANNIQIIKNALVDVTQHGTASKVFDHASYTAGGKTGTAQVFSLKGNKYQAHSVHETLRDHAWFIAYAPAEKPQIAIAVFVENGGFGAQAAAPIARKLFDAALKSPSKNLSESKPLPTLGHHESSTPTHD